MKTKKAYAIVDFISASDAETAFKSLNLSDPFNCGTNLYIKWFLFCFFL